MKAEREVNSLYAALLMEDRVGEVFAATVSSITDFGFFVELDAEHVEGLVRAEDLGTGHRLVVGALIWPDGRRVTVGQRLTARLAGVSVPRRQLTFEVVAFEGQKPLAPKPPGQKPPPGKPRRGPEKGRPAEKQHPQRGRAQGKQKPSGRPQRSRPGSRRRKR